MFCTSVSPSPTKLLICYLGVILDTIEYAKVYKVNLHLQVVQLALQLIDQFKNLRAQLRDFRIPQYSVSGNNVRQ